MLPAKILNPLLVDKIQDDPVCALNAVRIYVRDRLHEKFNDCPEDLKVELKKQAHVVTIRLLGTFRGKPVNGSKSWTFMSLLADPRRFPIILDELIFEVFPFDVSVAQLDRAPLS